MSYLRTAIRNRKTKLRKSRSMSAAAFFGNSSLADRSSQGIAANCGADKPVYASPGLASVTRQNGRPARDLEIEPPLLMPILRMGTSLVLIYSGRRAERSQIT
jgi:hypothetical protein